MIEFENCYICITKEKRAFIWNPYTEASAYIDINNTELTKEAVLESVEKHRKQLEEEKILGLNKSECIAISRFKLNKAKYARRLRVIDALTYACNVKCIYCFEEWLNGKVNKISIQEKMKEIERLFSLYENEIDLFDFCFFGGEPLIDLNYIEKMSFFLRKLCKEKGKELTLSIITNGTLISERFVQIALRFNFKTIMVTLDGTKEINDKRRPMKNGESTFENVIKGSHRILENTSMTLQINTVIDQTNYPFLDQYLSNLSKEFSQYLYSDRPRLILNFGTVCMSECANGFLKHNAIDTSSGYLEYYSLAEKALNLGFAITSPIFSNTCTAGCEKAFLFSPHGSIYKCITGLECSPFYLASMSSFLDNPVDFLIKNIEFTEFSHRLECLNCKFLFMCNGGCRFPGEWLCRKRGLEKELPLLVDLLSQIDFIGDSQICVRHLN